MCEQCERERKTREALILASNPAPQTVYPPEFLYGERERQRMYLYCLNGGAPIVKKEAKKEHQ
ncbi:unnamed protein product [Hymenolepis diminuta]|uniref:Uncharacterized protein n=1 Tax=Hymenolepis diminuta TaxID=6216 RepID=A0A564ZB72_HYMDI|nr:unnamed protein product [Hymenolepis diminuta]